MYIVGLLYVHSTSYCVYNVQVVYIICTYPHLMGGTHCSTVHYVLMYSTPACARAYFSPLSPSLYFSSNCAQVRHVLTAVSQYTPQSLHAHRAANALSTRADC